jgi:hypothetical protein
VSAATGQTAAKAEQVRLAMRDRWERAWELIRATDRVRLLAGGGPNDQRAFASAREQYDSATRWWKAVSR